MIATLKIDKTYVYGFMVGLTFTYPAPPFYFLSLVAFLLAIVSLKLKDKFDKVLFIGCVLFVALTFISHAISPFQHLISLQNVFVTGGFFVLFIFGFCIQKPIAFIQGYCAAMAFMAVYCASLFIYLKPYKEGVLMFVYPEFRMWAENFMPDWPNFMAFGFTAAFLLAFLVLKKNKLGLLLLFAALITTSRIAMLGTAFLFLAKARYHPVVAAFSGFVMLMVGLVFLNSLNLDMEIISQLLDRLSKTGDREAGYQFLIEELFYKSPWFGIGGLRVSDLPYFPPNFGSYHNSYLEVLVRFGVVAFIVFLVLIFPWKLIGATFEHKADLLIIISFILIASFFQNIFKHPSYFMLYSVLILKGGSFDEIPKKT